jgi:23S rRNA (uracil1939-C5)-methyltransferase
VQIECPHADRCAGCPAIDEPYDVQLAAKATRLAASLARFPALHAIERAPVCSADAVVGYRTRAKLVVEGPRVGLYAREGDHVVVDIPGCRVLPEVLARATEALRRTLAEDSRLARVLLAIDLREAHDVRGRASVLLTLVIDERARDELPPGLEARLRERIPELAVVAIGTRPRRSPTLLGRTPRVVAGPEEIDDVIDVGGRKVATPAVPGGFTQAHREQAARLRAHIVESLSDAGIPLDGARVVDAYAGAGALGLGLAGAGARVLLVESFAPAMERAKAAAERQGLAVSVAIGDAAEVLSSLARRGRSADVVVLNPPRRGVAPEVRRAAAALGPRRLVYVSCEPDTLARDLDHLARLGYVARRVEPFDMIPLSREVESLAVLEPAALPPPRVLHREDDLVVLDKPPHTPTTPHPEQPRSLLDDARTLPGFEDATAVHRLDEGTSGVALIARTPSDVEAWAQALASGQKTYLALVRGVARPKGTITRSLRIDGEDVEARTRYKRLAIVGGHSLLRVQPETGRTHQIRRHLAGLDHPVLGDTRYGHAPSNRHFEEQLTLDRTFLHAWKIELTTPRGAAITLTAPLPGDLRAVLDRLGGVPAGLE